jgi:hypothetical protein
MKIKKMKLTHMKMIKVKIRKKIIQMRLLRKMKNLIKMKLNKITMKI